MKRLDSLAILASAGCGKTFALTTRYLALMLSGVAPERILAVTFTRAAAGEILDRVLTRLREASQSDAGAAKLEKQLRENDTVPVPKLTAMKCRGTLRGLANAIDRLGVSTIDGFFARLAGAMMLDLDLAPGWRIVEGDEDQRLRARAIEEVVESGDEQETLRLVRLLHGGMFSSRVFGAVLEAVSAAHAVYVETESAVWGEIGPLSEPLDSDSLGEAIGALRTLRLPTNSDGRTVNEPWRKAHAAGVRRAETAAWEEFLGAGIACAVGTGRGEYSKKPIDDDVRIAYERLVTHARAVFLTQLRHRNAATRDVVASFDAAYQRLKRSLGASTFIDVPRALVRAKVAGDLDHVYYALDGRLDHVLIDEFQDTSLVQFGLLRPLMDEMAQDESGARSLLCVGDVKQSIYRWRGAEPELLPAVLSEWSTLKAKPLDESRRSSPEIIEAVNTVFGGLEENLALSESEGGALAAAAWGKMFHEHRTAVTDAGFVQLRVTGGSPDGSEHIDRAARHVADLARADPDGSIGVLFPKWKRVSRMLARLREMGVDAAIDGGSGVADSPAVAAVLSLMELADHPGNSAAAFHVASSPLGAAAGLSWRPERGRAGAVSASLRREVEEHGYAPTINRWANSVRPACSARDADRMRRLVELAERFDAGAGGRPTEFVSFVLNSRASEASGAQVRLLTVHGSKGLQFKSVVLADLDGLIKPGARGVLVERASPLAPITAVSRHASDLVRTGHPRLQAMNSASEARAIGESLSLLYVAMTRAERRLDMLIEPCEPGRTWPRTYAGLLHWALAPMQQRSAGEVLWSRGSAARAVGPGRVGERGAAPAVDVEAKSDPIRLGAPSGRITRASALAPSRAAEVRPATIADALREGAPAGTRERGTLVHAWMESVEWAERAPRIEELRRVTERAGLEWNEETVGLAERVHGVLADGPVRELMRRGAASVRWDRADALEVLRERAVAARGIGDDARLVLGRIDRLVLAREGGRVIGAEIIDYKTDAGGGSDGSVAALHGPQLRAYRGAVAAMYGLEPGRVRCAVVLVLQGRVVWVD